MTAKLSKQAQIDALKAALDSFDDRYDRRDLLRIESAGGSNLGNCYNAHNYRVISNCELKPERIKALREAGFLGYGQEYRVSPVDKQELRYVPNGVDWRGQPFTKEVVMPLFVYIVTDLVDSSDLGIDMIKFGKTWKQWYEAAGYDFGDIQRLDLMPHTELYYAWREGRDPSAFKKGKPCETPRETYSDW